MSPARIPLQLIRVAPLSVLACACMHPGFGDYANLVRADSSVTGVVLSPPESGVRITYLGLSSYLLQSQDATVLIDPYYSRIRYIFPTVFFFTSIAPDQERVAEGLEKLPPKVDYIVVTHGHFDHLLDVPEIAHRTNATVVLSPTSFYQAAAAGVPREQMRMVRPNESVDRGNVRISAYLGDHAPQFLGINFYKGHRDSAPESMRTIWDWKGGDILTLLIEMGGKRIFISSGSAKKLPPVSIAPVDLAVLGVAVEESREHFPLLVERLDPQFVQPTHQDRLTKPLSDGFRYGLKADMGAVRRKWSNLNRPGELILLDYYRPWTLR